MVFEKMQMKPQIIAKALGALMLLHALETFGYLHGALISLTVGSLTSLALGLLNLATWLLLASSGVGLIANKRWAFSCTLLFTLLSPVSMMFCLPLVGPLLSPGLPVLIGLLIVNLSVVAFAYHLRRIDGKPDVA